MKKRLLPSIIIISSATTFVSPPASNSSTQVPYNSNKGIQESSLRPLPFRPTTAKSFQNWINKIEWGPRNLKFSYIGTGGGCTNDHDWFHCKGGYLKISDPMGTKVCEVDSVFYLRPEHNGVLGSPNKVKYYTSSCRWQN